MHVKFLARGSGSAGAAAEYLLEEENAAGEERETVERLQQSTWGIRLQETPRGRFVVLPPGTLDRPPWRVGGRPAVRLSTK